MALWALIVSGQVADLTDTDPAGRFHPSLEWVTAPDGTATGDHYDGTKFFRAVDTDPAQPAVPQTVTKVQAVLALHALPGAETGKTLLDDVEASVAAASDPRVGLAWNNASEIDRNGLFVLQLAKAAPLNMTDAQLDELFTAAGKITV